MRHFALEGRQHVQVPRGVVRLSAHAGNGGSPVLEAWLGEQQLPVERARQGSGLVLRDVTTETLVRVRPSGAATEFAEPTLIRLTLRVDVPTEQYEIVVLPVDVGSLPHRTLATVAPVGDELLVTACDAVPDLEVGALAARARGQARRLLGFDRVRDDRAVRMAIGIDVSASMAYALHDGSVAAAVDVLGGLWQVVGDETEFPLLCLLGEETTWLPPVEPAAMARTLAGHVERHGFELGSRSLMPDPPGPAHPGRTARFVISDAVPADVGADGAVALLVLGGGVSKDEVAGSPVAVLAAAAPGEDPTERLLGRSDELTAVVATLLKHCGVSDR
ncbi:MAG TPA: hypothetical protein VFY38_14930 [Pseudonocardia sp.]|nr:hypothetical protein [Pseudonocardia sp.]